MLLQGSSTIFASVTPWLDLNLRPCSPGLELDLCSCRPRVKIDLHPRHRKLKFDLPCDAPRLLLDFR
ncbi:hypothetical protein E2562_038639 [Oryza meyeriana var. granulata]|uniref:Uncharacterized protein n=1 Tax=Oryza meyeriana var. granulata TaxID=110450 RepID=A0A6G1DU70_9ORYZ|nr:hypothetical protein E2562_038639 [Oryza meyeriana var. granulata]